MPDIRAIGARYAAAWTSHVPAAVASFYESDGRITVNGGEPPVGRSAIADMAKVLGWEQWLLSGDLLVRESLGRYDAVEYERQVAQGA